MRRTMKAEASRAGAWLLLAVVIVAASLVAAKIQAKSTAKESTRAAQREAQKIAALQLAKGCGRTQVQRGYLIIRARENVAFKSSTVSKQAAELFRTVWCERTYAVGYEGRTVFLPAASQRCFLKLLEAGYWNERDPYTDPARLKRACEGADLL